jgi:hypothetical protein
MKNFNKKNGFGKLFAQTPKWAQILTGFLISVAGAYLYTVTTFPGFLLLLPAKVQTIINTATGIGVPVIGFLLQLFFKKELPDDVKKLGTQEK